MKKAYFSLRRRAIVTPLWLAALALAVVVGFSTWIWNAAASTIVVVARGGEGGTGAHATRLATLLGDRAAGGGIDAIYVEDSPRSRATAAALANRLGLQPHVVAGDDPDVLARRALRGHAGERVLIVAAGDDLPAVVGALTGRAPPPAGDQGLLYVIGVPRIGRANVLRLLD